MITFHSETWADVKDEFDELGRKNFEECKIAEGRKPYSLYHGAFDFLDEQGLVHVTTARDGGRLVGYILTILSQRHLQFEAFCSQSIGIFLMPEFRKGGNGLKLLENDEKFLRLLGVEKMYAGYTIEKDLGPLFIRRGWKGTEMHYTKWVN